ncbi:MAG: hypothetical protein ABMA64_10260 [Myxococcota bacterium]
MRFVLTLVLSAGVVFGFGSGYASLAGWHPHGGSHGETHGCPHADPAP